MARPKKQPVARIGAGNRAVIYLRVSGEEQAKDGYGLEDQEDKCRRYTDDRGYSVVAVLKDEALKGTKPVSERPALQQALEMCSKGMADVLVTKAQDRLARDTEIWPQ